ncbi:PKD domain-containing protein [Candidatus Bipolaricaulota bacterium]|nr:PKD domain-containing protein [Candidatus Bipolaricaulota bacterium]
MSKWQVVIEIVVLIVLCSVFLVFGEEEHNNLTVEIVTPLPGVAFNIGDIMTLDVRNFTRRPQDGIVRVTVHNDDWAVGRWEPFFKGRGDGWVELRVNVNFDWTNKEKGEATIELLWETGAVEESLFPEGNYRIRARIWLRGDTAWSDEISVTIGSPETGAEIVELSPNPPFYLNQVVSVTGRTWGLAPPLDVSLEVSGADLLDEYQVVAQIRSDREGSFTIDWRISDVIPGDYHIRVNVTDSAGYSATSDPRTIIINPRPGPQPTISITVNGNALAEFDTERQQLIRFGIKRYPEDLDLQSFEWDFGDGDSSILPSAEHAYRAKGIYEVSLVAWSGPRHEGIRYEAERVTIDVTPKDYVTATREISGFPSIEKDETTILPEFSLTVRVGIEIYHEVYAVTLREVIPAHWTLSDSTPSLAHNDGVEILTRGSTTSDAGKPLNWEWIIIGNPLLPGQKIFVVYTLQAPTDADPRPVSLTGGINVGSAAGLVGEETVEGQSEFSIVRHLPIEVVIAHIQPDLAITPRVFNTPTISEEQLEIAKRLWQNNTPVPYAANEKTISMETFLKLIVYHNESVPITFRGLERFAQLQ